jgi:putative membrane protein
MRLSGLLSLAGCAALATTAAIADAPPAQRPAENDTNKLSTADRDFLEQAAIINLHEVEAGNLALKKTRSQPVKELAEAIVNDHARSNSELQKLAAEKHVPLPTALPADVRADVDKMSALPEPGFDTQYVNAMIEGHDRAVELFKKEAAEGQDADVKAFATKTIPNLYSHGQMARSTLEKLNTPKARTGAPRR